MFSSAIFDMDGLLLDSEKPIREAWKRAIAEFGFLFRDSFYLQVVGKNENDTRQIFEKALGPNFDYAAVSRRVQVILDEEISAKGYSVKTGARELLSRLISLEIPCGVASSTNHDEIRKRLVRTGMANYFSCFTGGDEVRYGKPSPDLFLLAAERLSIAPELCLVFEDSEYGVQAAKSAGMGVILVPDLKQPTHEFRQMALSVIPSLHEAMGLIDILFAVN